MRRPDRSPPREQVHESNAPVLPKCTWHNAGRMQVAGKLRDEISHGKRSVLLESANQELYLARISYLKNYTLHHITMVHAPLLVAFAALLSSVHGHCKHIIPPLSVAPVIKD
jgi:hypothetical protein